MYICRNRYGHFRKRSCIQKRPSIKDHSSCDLHFLRLSFMSLQHKGCYLPYLNTFSPLWLESWEKSLKPLSAYGIRFVSKWYMFTCSAAQRCDYMACTKKKSSLLLRCLLYGDFQTFLKHSWASLCGSNHVKLSVKLGPPHAFCKASPKRCPNLLQSTWRKQMKARIQPFRI